MIESGDVNVNVLKTLETYNAIHRIPASLIRRHFTVTVINGREIKVMTALHMAAAKGNVEMVKLLLLHPAIDVNAVDSEDGYTTLHAACYTGRAEVVKVLLLDDRVDVNKTNNYRLTPFYTACRHGYVEAVKILLLDERVDVNRTDKWGCTPLYTACSNGHVEVTSALLFDDRVDVNKNNIYSINRFAPRTQSEGFQAEFSSRSKCAILARGEAEC
eukprot:scaffold2238_cov333-Ochromonas_danica.AAC.1